jgi:membrane protein required for beta-lactamase induction
VIVMMVIVIVMLMVVLLLLLLLLLLMGVPVVAEILLTGVPVISVVAGPGDQRHMRGVDSGAEHLRRREIVPDTQTAQGSLQL